MTLPMLPTMPDGTKIGAMQVSLVPPRFIYGTPDVLEWLRAELVRRESIGMPPPQDTMPNWR